LESVGATVVTILLIEIVPEILNFLVELTDELEA